MKTYRLKELLAPNRSITYGIVQPGPDVRPFGIPLIRGKDYSSGKVSLDNLYCVLPSIDAPYKRSKVRPKDILLSIAGYVGQIAIVPKELDGANITQTTARISCEEKKVHYQFLFYALQSDSFQSGQIKKYEKGSAQSGLNLKDVGEFQVQLPDLNTQRKIAKILNSADAVIEKTEAAIAKYKAIKQGMMQDLFTRGIDLQTGQLRPACKDTPILYQALRITGASKLHTDIPKDWNVKRLSEVITLRHGYQFRDFDFTPEGIDVIKIGQVGRNGRLDLKSSSKIDFSRLKEFDGIRLHNGDILMALTGATLGKTALVRDIKEPLVQNYRVGYFNPKNSDELHKPYLYYLLSGDLVQNEILGFVNTGAQGNIGKADFEKIKVAIPKDLEEQKLIANRLVKIDSLIETEQANLAKHHSLKKGLMQDLLTGRVEVEV